MEQQHQQQAMTMYLQTLMCQRMKDMLQMYQIHKKRLIRKILAFPAPMTAHHTRERIKTPSRGQVGRESFVTLCIGACFAAFHLVSAEELQMIVVIDRYSLKQTEILINYAMRCKFGIID
jgi:hypothetical protein